MAIFCLSPLKREPFHTVNCKANIFQFVLSVKFNHAHVMALPEVCSTFSWCICNRCRGHCMHLTLLQDSLQAYRLHFTGCRSRVEQDQTGCFSREVNVHKIFSFNNLKPGVSCHVGLEVGMVFCTFGTFNNNLPSGLLYKSYFGLSSVVSE